ncbi:tripartite tricarboxylate transporter TctB family protein, partial [Paracoccus benzoatiresistens]
MSTKPKDQTDIAAGLFFMALGGFFGWQALQMEIGTSLRMGPGYFPIVLSGLLFLLGAVILFKAFGRPDDEPFGRIAWRGILFILPAPIFFGL